MDFFHRFLYVYQRVDWPNKFWLVVSTILKNISQWEGLSHILWKNKKCSKPPTRISFSKITFPSQGRLLPELVHRQLVVFGAIRLLRPENPGKKSCNHWGNARKPEKNPGDPGEVYKWRLSWENHGKSRRRWGFSWENHPLGCFVVCQLEKLHGNQREIIDLAMSNHWRVDPGSYGDLSET